MILNKSFLYLFWLINLFSYLRFRYWYLQLRPKIQRIHVLLITSLQQMYQIFNQGIINPPIQAWRESGILVAFLVLLFGMPELTS